MRKHHSGMRMAGVALSLALVAAFGPPNAAVGAGPAPRAQGVLITVNSTGDGPNLVGAPNCDADLATPGPQCTLRAAIQAANLSPGDDGIEFSIPLTEPFCDGTGRCVINLTRALPDVGANVEIIGPGADKLTVRRGNGTGVYSVFTVLRNGASPISVNFSGLTISNGLAPNRFGVLASAGGGIFNYVDSVNVTNCTFSENDAFIGGGIANFASMTVVNSTFVNNSASGDGAGIYNDNDFAEPMRVVNSTLRNNNSSRNGGGIANYDSLSITGSTLADNSAVLGGGVYSGGTTVIRNSTLSGNSAQDGGAIYGSQQGLHEVENSSVVANSASRDGGGFVNKGLALVRSSIVALNTAADSGPDVSGSFTLAGARGFNLIGVADGSTGFVDGANNDQVGSAAAPLDPRLDPAGLRNNGGPTRTIALLPDSPAVDKGQQPLFLGPLNTDQRGAPFARTFDDPGVANAGDGTDIGAFEAQGLASAGASLVGESCPPDNGAADPGERVTFSLGLANNGSAAATNLVATLQPSASVIAPSGPQSYGPLPPGGSASRPFSFTAGGSPGQAITLTLRLQDGAADLGVAIYSVVLGTNTSCSTARLVTRTTLTRSGADVIASVSVQNQGNLTASDVTLTQATLGAVGGAPVPQLVDSALTPGETSVVQITFPDPGAAGASALLRVRGSYDGGSRTFGGSGNVTLP